MVGQNPSTGHLSRRYLGKNKKNKRPYISRISSDASWHNFGLRVRFVDVINCAKFYRNRLRGLDSVSGQSLTIPLDRDVAINNVWSIPKLKLFVFFGCKKNEVQSKFVPKMAVFKYKDRSVKYTAYPIK